MVARIGCRARNPRAICSPLAVHTVILYCFVSLTARCKEIESGERIVIVMDTEGGGLLIQSLFVNLN